MKWTPSVVVARLERAKLVVAIKAKLVEVKYRRTPVELTV
jgi:hypothetical protein